MSLFEKKNTATSSKNEKFRDSPVDAPNREAINVRTNEFEIDKAKESWGLSMQVKKLLITLAVCLVGFLVYKYGISENTTSTEITSIEKNTELEQIENQIIIQLEGSRNKAELLSLITQLEHTDNENYVEGKKQGIIASDVNDPDDMFYGTYTEYWSGIREGYKEIVTRDLSIEEYKLDLNSKQSKINTAN